MIQLNNLIEYLTTNAVIHKHMKEISFKTGRLESKNKRELVEYARTVKKEATETLKTNSLTIEELMADNEGLLKKLEERDDIIDFLHSENKILLDAILLKVTEDKYELFLAYICAYYKVSMDTIKNGGATKPLPYIRQVICYFLNTVFDMTLLKIKEILNYSDHTVPLANINKIRDLLYVGDREVLRDVLAHKQWLRKLSNG